MRGGHGFGLRCPGMAASRCRRVPVALVVMLSAVIACSGGASVSEPATPAEAASISSPAASTSASAHEGAASDAASAPSAAEFGGRYAVDVVKTLKGTHARNWVREDGRASFVLSLNAGGEANACRGIRSLATNDGPNVHTRTDTASQQGYRGRWERKGEWLHVALNVDDSRCARQPLYDNLAPQRWLLRCRTLTPGEHSQYGEPLLACALDNEAEHQYRESFGYFVPEVIAGEWLLLGKGDGLRVDWHDDSVPPGANPSQVTLTPAKSRVEDDTWTKR